MPLTVHSCVSYSPGFGELRTQDDWTALNFVHAVKHTPLGGFAVLALPDGEAIRVDKQTSQDAPRWFARLAVAALPWRDLLPCGFVPVPDAACSLAADRPSRTSGLAEALASELGPDAAAMDLLRWVRPMLPAHLVDDSRDPQVLYGRLRLRDRWPFVRGHRLVLVDDVVASGAHVRAAAAFLSDCGATVLCAVCAAGARRSAVPGVSFPSFAPLSRWTQVFPDFQSDPDWLLPEVYDRVRL